MFVAGMSSGAALAAVMGVRHPDLVAGVFAHSGVACGAAGSPLGALGVLKRGAERAPHRSLGLSPAPEYQQDDSGGDVESCEEGHQQSDPARNTNLECQACSTAVPGAGGGASRRQWQLPGLGLRNRAPDRSLACEHSGIF